MDDLNDAREVVVLMLTCNSFPNLLTLNCSYLTMCHGLSVGLPGPINLSLMLQTFAPRNVRSYN